MKKWVVGSAAVGLLWVVISVVWAPAYMVATTPYPVDQNPGNRGLPFQRINIPSGDLSLEGWWIPAESPRAELIFVHGAGSNRVSQFIGSLDFYRTLHELGVSVITMDLRNHGNSPVTDGVLRMGAAEWPDVIAAAAWLDQHQASGLPRIALGASMGAAPSSTRSRTDSTSTPPSCSIPCWTSSTACNTVAESLRASPHLSSLSPRALRYPNFNYLTVSTARWHWEVG